MAGNLTSSLEDYLETIYLLQEGRNQEARVRDIAAARSVKASSVSPALRRLSEMGYLKYEQRESIRLTELGLVAARRVYARHVLLFQFFHDILGMPEDKAREEACGLEHALSEEGMDRFVRFFEARMMCPHGAACTEVRDNCQNCTKHSGNHMKFSEIKDGEIAFVCQIKADGAKRQVILDMGILPNVSLHKCFSAENHVIVKVGLHELVLTKEQCESIIVTFRDA